MAGKLICLLGKSGAGKDTLFHKIISDQTIDIKPVIPYTTRPIRSGETEGVQYHFVTVEQMQALQKQNQIIELREYDTLQGKWYYFTASETLENSRCSLLITTPLALTSIARWYGKDHIVPVMLALDDKTRLERSIRRESQQHSPNYAELCRRYLADENDFSDIDFSGYPHYFFIDAGACAEDCVAQFREILDRLSTLPDR